LNKTRQYENAADASNPTQAIPPPRFSRIATSNLTPAREKCKKFFC
jgi:hypothetical protein